MPLKLTEVDKMFPGSTVALHRSKKFRIVISRLLGIQQTLHFAPTSDTRVPVSIPNPLLNVEKLAIFRDARINRTDFDHLEGLLSSRKASWPVSTATAGMPTLPRRRWQSQVNDDIEKWTRP